MKTIVPSRPLFRGEILIALLALSSSAFGVGGATSPTNTVTPGAGTNGSYRYSIDISAVGISISNLYLPLLTGSDAVIANSWTSSLSGTFSVVAAGSLSAPTWNYDTNGFGYAENYGELLDDFLTAPFFLVFTLDTPLATGETFTFGFDSFLAPVNGPYQVNASETSWFVIDPPVPVPEPAAIAGLAAALLAVALRRRR